MNVYKIGNAPAGAMYIGRGSAWGNPFVIGKDGNRAEVIDKFYRYAVKKLKDSPEWLTPLKGKDLVCFCSPLPCHGGIIIQLINKGEKSE